MASDCLQELQRLLLDQSIAGYALISQNGCVECAFGNLEDEFGVSSTISTSTPILIPQILAAFRGGEKPSQFTVGGKNLIVVRQEERYVYAVSKKRTLSISLHYLALGGICVVAYETRDHQSAVGPLRDSLL